MLGVTPGGSPAPAARQPVSLGQQGHLVGHVAPGDAVPSGEMEAMERSYGGDLVLAAFDWEWCRNAKCKF